MPTRRERELVLQVVDRGDVCRVVRVGQDPGGDHHVVGLEPGDRQLMITGVMQDLVDVVVWLTTITDR